ncbi:MAG: type II toxin-antitoxin system VapC family toxin [Alphaproteobacteria bacterium]|nr:type II toxin-antitoxin system VapC family toxin [Alphaproteobacteria bacterium]
MLLYMLDTDICSYILRQCPISVMETLEDKIRKGHHACISVVTYRELIAGLDKDGNPRFHIDEILERLTHHDMKWDFECERKFAALSAAYVRKYPKSNFDNIRNDVMIASQALAYRAVVVTNNERDFARIRRIGGPVWENWVSVSR